MDILGGPAFFKLITSKIRCCLCLVYCLFLNSYFIQIFFRLANINLLTSEQYFVYVVYNGQELELDKKKKKHIDGIFIFVKI